MILVINDFKGMECHGVPEYVIVNGRVCLDEEQLRVVEGYGSYIETPVFPPFVYDKEKFTKDMSHKSENGAVCDMINVMSGNVSQVTVESSSENFSHIYFVLQLKLDPQFCPTPTFSVSDVGTPCCKGPRPEGQRNIQESTFSISG